MKLVPATASNKGGFICYDARELQNSSGAGGFLMYFKKGLFVA